jgi:hypothetical protein
MGDKPMNQRDGTKALATLPAAEEGSAADRDIRELGPMLDQVAPLTTTPRDALVDLVRLVRAVLTFNIPGNFVECGCYRGGAGILMAHVLREAGVQDRKVWLFDSFEGLPEPEAIDGAAALEYAANADAPENYDNCRASFEETVRTIQDLGLAPYTECVKGWFDQTLPAHRERIGPIAVLRVDGNWHASVRCCLDTLYDQVVDDGFVIGHTYYTYDGCSTAVHEFLGERRLPYRMEGVLGRRPGEVAEDYLSALFHKGETTWHWLRRAYLTTREVEALVPPGAAFIFADQEELGLTVSAGRRALPFLEREGEYFGPPEDDATAIAELERMRREGAGFLIVAWPVLWWLGYYTEFIQYVRSRYPCLVENERLVAFDLR